MVLGGIKGISVTTNSMVRNDHIVDRWLTIPQGLGEGVHEERPKAESVWAIPRTKRSLKNTTTGTLLTGTGSGEQYNPHN